MQPVTNTLTVHPQTYVEVAGGDRYGDLVAEPSRDLRHVIDNLLSMRR
jgi:hypothetical protein